MNRRHELRYWLIPLCLMLLIAPFTPWIDQLASGTAYSLGDAYRDHFYNPPLFVSLYVYGEYPGLTLASASLVLFLASFAIPKLSSWRKPTLYLFLVVALGAGVIVNVLLKDHWGRPRPKQVITYGGEQAYRPFWKPNFFDQPTPSRSFPCGHCAMGFAFFSFVFLGKRYRLRWLRCLGWTLALSLGILLSVARVSQGGHFVSDTLFAALIMWLVSLALDELLFAGDEK